MIRHAALKPPVCNDCGVTHWYRGVESCIAALGKAIEKVKGEQAVIDQHMREDIRKVPLSGGRAARHKS